MFREVQIKESACSLHKPKIPRHTHTEYTRKMNNQDYKLPKFIRRRSISIPLGRIQRKTKLNETVETQIMISYHETVLHGQEKWLK